MNEVTIGDVAKLHHPEHLRFVVFRNNAPYELSRELPCHCFIEWLPQGSRVLMCAEHEAAWLKERNVERVR